MKKNQVIYMNFVLILLLFVSHIYMIMQISEYIPWENRKFSSFEYPSIKIEWTWAPPMSGIAGGVSLFDVSLIVFAIALIVNVVALFRKEKANIGTDK